MTVKLLLPFALLAAAVLTGCSTSASDSNPVRRADGSEIHWTLRLPESGKPEGILLVAQGSGCAPAARNPMVEETWAIAPELALLTVEKYGVTPTDTPDDPIEGCSADYVAHHTVSQRVADIHAVLARLRSKAIAAGPLVLFGGSEGGATVARLAPLVPADAVIVYSVALGEPLATAMRRVVPLPVIAKLDAMLKVARTDPGRAGQWGGNSYRWWADIAEVRLVEELMRSTAPVLMIQGARDQFAPVEAARAAADAYRTAGRCELTYREYAGYDHFMTDEVGVSRRDDVFRQARQWVADVVPDGVGCD